MKLTALLSFLLINTIFVNAQSLTWQWAQAPFATTQANGTNIQSDAYGNIYVAGSFSGKLIIFGNDTIFNTDTSGLYQDVFLLKYNSAGNITWKTGMGANSFTNSTALATDAGGNVYLAGYFIGSPLIIGNDTLNNVGTTGSSTPFFVVKYNSSGGVVWTATGDSTMRIAGIAADANSNVYVTGYYTDPTVILGNDTLTNAGTTDAFVAKYDSTGHAVWAKNINGVNYQAGRAITADANGNSYVTGVFNGATVTIGGVTLTNNATSGENIFTAKYDPLGNVMWAKSAGGASYDGTYAIAIDAQSNVYITGAFLSDTFTFGDTILINPDSNGYADAFIAKYDAGGNAKWANCPQSNDQTNGFGITTGANGELYVTGSFSGSTIIFGRDTLLSVDSLGQEGAIFIATYDTLGNIVWLATAGAGGTGGHYSNSITTDPDGNVYVTGNFYTNYMIFGADTIYGLNLDEATNAFIAKYGTATTGIISVAGAANTITVYPNPSTGQFYFKGIAGGSILQVYDVMGRNIYSGEVTGDSYLLNISGNSRGIYFYRVVDREGNVQEGKMAVQ